MLQELEQAGISTAGQRGYHLLGRSARDGLICFGTRRGKQQTFVLLDEWVPLTRSLPRDEALAELTRRYFTSHGPATVQDLMHWAGLTAAEAKTGLAAAGMALIQETIADRVCWMPCEAPEINLDTLSVHLLPGFDEYLLGYRDRSAVLDPAHAQRIHPGGNGMFGPTIVIDGVVTGTWKRTFKGSAVVIEATPFRPLTAAENETLTEQRAPVGLWLHDSVDGFQSSNLLVRDNDFEGPIGIQITATLGEDGSCLLDDNDVERVTGIGIFLGPGAQGCRVRGTPSDRVVDEGTGNVIGRRQR